MVLSLLSDPILRARLLYHHCYPVSNHCIHHHIEYGGVKIVPLHHPLESLELLTVVDPCL